MFSGLGKLANRGMEGDLYHTEARSKTVSFEGGVLRQCEIEDSEGFGLRVINGDRKLGFVAFNSPSLFDEMLEKACSVSKFGDRVAYSLPSYPVLKTWDSFVDRRVVDMGFAEMIEIGNYVVERIREEYPEVVLNLSVKAGIEGKELINHHQERLFFERTFFGVEAEVNLTRESDILGFSVERFWGNRDIDLDLFINEILFRLEFSQREFKIKSGDYPVLFTSEGLLVLLYPLFYALNGRNIAFNRSFLRDKLGKLVFSPLLSLVETPYEAWTLGSCPFDDEGITTVRERELIVTGEVKSAFWDLFSAFLEGVEPSGNGFRQSYRALPYPELSCIKIKGGLRNQETLIEELERGLIVDSVLGLGQSNISSGHFSCNLNLGFYVEDGEIKGRVKNVMISGNAFEALKNIQEVSRDSRWIYGRWFLPWMVVEPIRVDAKN